MPLGSRSYVTRDCDEDLKKAAKDHGFIWIEGDNEFGKSSLLKRHNDWLAQGWSIVSADFAACVTSSDSLCRRTVFALMERSIRKWNSIQFSSGEEWIALMDLAQHSKLAFVIDEIGACRDEVLKELLQKFHSLTDFAPDQVKIVAAFKHGPAALIPSCGLHAPKFLQCWEVVRLGAFREAHVRQLVDLFPLAISTSLLNRLQRLQAITNFEPRKVQRVFHSLWLRLETLNGHWRDCDALVDSQLGLEVDQ